MILEAVSGLMQAQGQECQAMSQTLELEEARNRSSPRVRRGSTALPTTWRSDSGLQN